MLISRRNLMGGKSLPYDKRIQWVETYKGGPYVSLGLKTVYASNPIRVEFSVKNISLASYAGIALGGYVSYCVAINWFATSNTVVANNGGRGDVGKLVDSSSGVVKNVPIIVEFLDNEIVARQNEVVIGRMERARAKSVSVNLFLCRGAGAYAQVSPAAGNRIYSFYAKFGASGQEEELDLIPVVATFDGVQEVCFYNRAYTEDGKNGLEFYRNAGSGEFIAGPDVT